MVEIIEKTDDKLFICADANGRFRDCEEAIEYLHEMSLLRAAYEKYPEVLV